MVSSPEEFLESYLWKNVDISINKAEYRYILKDSKKDPVWVDLFTRFKHLTSSENAYDCYIIVLSNVDVNILQQFFIYYSINCYYYDNMLLDSNHMIDTINVLKDFIGNNEHKFKIFILSMHFYF